MSKIGICLGGVENGKMVYCDNEIYYALVDGYIVNYRNVDLRYHPTQKPVALLEYLIKTYTQENETVLDLAREIIGDDYVC